MNDVAILFAPRVVARVHAVSVTITRGGQLLRLGDQRLRMLTVLASTPDGRPAAVSTFSLN